MVTWVVFLAIGLVTGIAAGIFLSRLDMLKSKKTQLLEEQLEQTRNELDTYRTEVARHFVQTSSLINNMTESYRAVFDHLSVGARELCGDRLATHLLDLPRTRMLEQEERARANADVQMTGEAISDIEEEIPLAAVETAEAEAAAEPVQETKAEVKDEVAPTRKSRKAGNNRSKPEPVAAAAEDDEHAAFAGEQGIPPEATAAATAPQPAEEPQKTVEQPTVH